MGNKQPSEQLDQFLFCNEKKKTHKKCKAYKDVRMEKKIQRSTLPKTSLKDIDPYVIDMDQT